MSTTPKTGVLLMNIGSPDAPDTKSVRRYLREFLSDPRVIDIPALGRWLLLNLIILPFRPKQSAKAYQKIWDNGESPLIKYSMAFNKQLSEQLGERFVVETGMRYGSPSIETAVRKLKHQKVDRIILFPLFPQYSLAATQSAVDCADDIIHQHMPSMNVSSIVDFYEDPGFVEAYTTLIHQSLGNFDPDCLLFSYHGLPERHIQKVGCSKEQCNYKDKCPAKNTSNQLCYRRQCFVTSDKVAEALNLTQDQYRVSFQSRLGRTPWIEPYTDVLLPKLAQDGVKKLAVVCPSFVTDCLETLEEIGIRGREQWKEVGGERFKLIPCLNTTPLWVSAAANLIAGRNKEF